MVIFMENSTKIEKQYLLKVNHTTTGTKTVIEVDTNKMTYNSLIATSANDKGNRTILFDKFKDDKTGVVYQLVAYIGNKQVLELEKIEKNAEALRIRDENERLKMENAQYQTLVNSPEYIAFMQAQMKNLK